MKKPFYITTTLPYVNADPHVGFALEIVHADVVARYQKLIGNEVFFNTGTDEHGVKVYNEAVKAKKDPQTYTDEYAEKFRELKGALGLVDDIQFIRTTDAKHKAAAQEFWKRCKAAGDIYKKNYKIKYCVGCELEKTDSELVEGKCPVHPHLTVEIREEENYFFAFSKYADKLVALYDKNPDFVVPNFRLNEMKVFIKEKGLEDFSISRLKTKMPWGVSVPDDADHVMYVWFDALVNYISTIGWPHDMKSYEKWWPVVQFAGKDQVRQQAAMWQAMLMSVGLPASKQIVIHGFIQSGGQKMSKSLGNVIDPYKVVEEYGTEALRYFLARETSFFEDSDFTMERFKNAYNTNLANGLGNLVSRVMKMATTHLEKPVSVSENTIPDDFKKALDVYDVQAASNIVWKYITDADQLIQEKQPFKLVKTDKPAAVLIIQDLCVRLYTIGRMLNPILPKTSEVIKQLVAENKMPSTPLFLRKE